VEAGGGLLLRSESFGGSSSDLGALVAASPFGVREDILLVATIRIHLTQIQIQKGRTRYKRSLQLSKKNIQHFNTWNFIIFFYFFGSLLPDPLT
jgi:hypothetical protein